MYSRAPRLTARIASRQPRLAGSLNRTGFQTAHQPNRFRRRSSEIWIAFLNLRSNGPHPFRQGMKLFVIDFLSYFSKLSVIFLFVETIQNAIRPPEHSFWQSQ